MAIVLPEANIAGFQIDKSVGFGGVNLSQDISTIKVMLNRITPQNGGSGGTLDEENTEKSGAEFDNLVNQIMIFQAVNFPEVVNGKKNPFYFSPDGIVGVERSTIKKMRALVSPRQGGVTTSSLKVLPNSPVNGDCDMAGFSAAGLRRDAGGQWATRAFPPEVSQFVPKGGSRTLLVKTSLKDTDWMPFGHDEAVVSAVKEDNKLVLKGLSPGKTVVRIQPEGGGAISVNVVVRSLQTLKLNIVELGASTSGIAATIRDGIIFGLNSLLTSQANVSIQAGTITSLTSIQTFGKSLTLQANRSLLITNNQSLGNPLGDLVDPKDLISLASRDKTLTLFTHPMVMKPERPQAIGSSMALDSRCAWINTSAGSLFTLFVAHELCHAMGMHHVTAPRSDFFLMNESINVVLNGANGLNRQIIPSETLSDLRI
jgi:hypothetical protein